MPSDSRSSGTASRCEQAQHHFFAVHGRHDRNAQVDGRAANGDLDAAVLRQPALGDVEAGHDLEARDDGGAQAERQCLDLPQQAVDTEPDR